MSKSTPLNQLPSMNGFVPTPQQTQFVNEPQRQMVQNAQQAAQNFSMPQNTQLTHDVPNENDSSIQDILNELNVPQNSMNEPHQMPPMPQLPPMHPIDNGTNMMGGGLLPPMDPSIAGVDYANFGAVMNQQAYQQGEVQSGQDAKSRYIAALMSWNNDIKIALFAVAVFILVSIVPIETYIYKYVALDKIPYSATIIKAVVAGILLIILMHFNR